MTPNVRLFLLLLAMAACASYYMLQTQAASPPHNEELAAADVPKTRTKRGAFWDFLQKIGITTNLVIDQYVDTRNTFNEVHNIVNEGFSDPDPTKPTLTPPTTKTPSGDGDDMATTTEAYKISRYDLGRVFGRNFRGLQRLTKIEFQDALNQTQYNLQEYRQEARKQFANSVVAEKKEQLLNLKG